MIFINIWLRRMLAFTPMFVMILGAAAIIGWVTHNPWLVRFNAEASTWPPISQWAALGFFLLGWAHLGRRTWRYSKWVAGFLLTTGSIFLIENVFSISTPLDYAWANYWTDAWIMNPGRLALGTSVCLFLAAQHMLAKEKSTQEMLGSAIAAIASVHLLNFAMDPMRQSINLMSHMSTPAAIGFCVWGIYCTFGGRNAK